MDQSHGWNDVKKSPWSSHVLDDGTWIVWVRDIAGNVSKDNATVTIDTYYKEDSTVDGGPPAWNNPVIPAGFKPKEDTTDNPGNTGYALWTDQNGKPSDESVNNRFSD